MLGIGEYFPLRGVFFAPLPLLLQIFGKLVGVLHAGDVAASAWIAVPVPGAANAAACFDYPCVQALLAQLIEHVNSGESRSHNHCIDGLIILVRHVSLSLTIAYEKALIFLYHRLWKSGGKKATQVDHPFVCSIQ